MKTLVTVHATMTTAGRPMTTRDVDRRDRQHGFTRIGYHFVIQRDGTIGEGRTLAEASMHDDPRDAKAAISVCLIGGADNDGGPEENFTDEQWESLIELVGRFNTEGNIRLVSKTPAMTTDRLSRQVVRPR